jgi:hypothetical protein
MRSARKSRSISNACAAILVVTAGFLPGIVACSRAGAEPEAHSLDAGAESGSRVDAKFPTFEPACGGLSCELYASPAEAFARVLEENPRVLAVGETHPRQGVEAKSTAARFVDELMPLLDGRATDLVVELWVAKSGCAARQKAEVRAVASAQREVTQAQAPKNQSDFLRLYTAGRAHGERVHLLIPPCDEYGKILDAGAGDVDAMLTMIANLSVTEIEKGLGAPDAGLVVAYGGAMHNDLVPRPGHGKWSFGPRVSTLTQGRYVELDLVVPEAVQDTEAWRAQPWYPHFHRGLQGEKTLLYRVRKGSFALVFPEEKTRTLVP